MYKPSSAVAGPAPLPPQQEPICRPGCAGRKHNYHQACLAVLGSCSGSCWALITPAAAFPDGLGSKGCWLSALGLPSAGLEPLQLDPWTQLCWGSWAQPIRPGWITEHFLTSKCGQVSPSTRSPLCGTRRKHRAELPQVTQGQPCSAQDRAQGAVTGINTTLRISLLPAQGR